MSDISQGLLPLQLRRQQEELKRWRALEEAGRQPQPDSVAQRRRPESAPRRRPPSTPRREVAELQALVMERRELMARQRQHRNDSSSRVSPARTYEGHHSREGSPPKDEQRGASDDVEPLATGGWLEATPRAASPVRTSSPAPGSRAVDTAGERSGASPRSAAATVARSRERADALELQLAQKEAALGRTRIAAERSASLAAQAQAEAARLRGELDDARELRLAAMTEAREWRSTAEASGETVAATQAKMRALEEEVTSAHAAAAAATEAAEAAEASAAAAAARAFSAEVRRVGRTQPDEPRRTRRRC